METIGFADHFAQGPPYATPLWEDRGPGIIDQLRKETAGISAEVEVLIGCEADMLEVKLCSIDATYAKTLDYVVMAASHFHLPGVQKPESDEPQAVAQHYLKFISAALDLEFVCILAHPFLTPFHTLGSPQTYMPLITDSQLYTIAERARERRVAMEVNSYLGQGAEYLEPMARFFDICKEVGVRFTYGSDAHHMKDLGPTRAIEQAIDFLGLSPDNFLNREEFLERAW